MCQSMKWAHLPVAGGLYDQDPQLLDEWEIIFRRVARKEEEERRKREAEARRRKK